MPPPDQLPPQCSGKLFADLSAKEAIPAAEIFDVLLAQPGLRIERIVSHGQSSPPGFWYDQAEAEWVLLAAGAALVQIEGEAAPRRLQAGDWINLPAHCRHRVTWTDPDLPSVWLAVHYSTPK
jgi:cupin 2 domain-containing protein